MKKILMCLLLCVFCSQGIFAQKLAINKVDKFTKESLQETSGETLFSVNLLGTGFVYRFLFLLKKAGEEWYMPAEITLKEMVKYDDNSGIVLLLSNGETVVIS